MFSLVVMRRGDSLMLARRVGHGRSRGQEEGGKKKEKKGGKTTMACRRQYVMRCHSLSSGLVLWSVLKNDQT